MRGFDLARGRCQVGGVVLVLPCEASDFGGSGLASWRQRGPRKLAGLVATDHLLG